MDLAGSTLGPFRVLSKISSGAMGRVVLAEVCSPSGGLRAGERVALKLIHPHLLASDEFLQRFLREAEAGRRVTHPRVVRTLGAGTVDADGTTLPYIAMEFVEGTNLQELRKESPRFPEAACRRIGGEVARGLAAVHAAGIVHRDLKPENVLCPPGGGVKIADFGVARVLEEAARLSHAGQILGSLLYASPEQLLGQDLDGRADLYSLGWILHTLAAGEHPLAAHLFAAAVMEAQIREAPPDLRAADPSLSPFFTATVECLLQKDRERRFPSAEALAETLELGEESPWWRERAPGAARR